MLTNHVCDQGTTEYQILILPRVLTIYSTCNQNFVIWQDEGCFEVVNNSWGGH